ncbi:hypothetical protein BJY01DRAFT_214534 [Aspergillus pseudoustus]|uniref:ATPase AAA-type core domain-containing protein n=1 Tax=Aspergillus pseudoustus TaxID=1810923 RepID=A0ABR4JY50_9EURO
MKLAFTLPRNTENRLQGLFSLLNGGPGTGKTWVAAAITECCPHLDLSTLIIAPSHQCLDHSDASKISFPKKNCPRWCTLMACIGSI